MTNLIQVPKEKTLLAIVKEALPSSVIDDREFPDNPTVDGVHYSWLYSGYGYKKNRASIRMETSEDPPRGHKTHRVVTIRHEVIDADALREKHTLLAKDNAELRESYKKNNIYENQRQKALWALEAELNIGYDHESFHNCRDDNFKGCIDGGPTTFNLKLHDLTADQVRQIVRLYRTSLPTAEAFKKLTREQDLCRDLKLCNFCGSRLTGLNLPCTNGRCYPCHEKNCTSGGSTHPATTV